MDRGQEVKTVGTGYVLVRAYGDEPVRLMALRWDRTSVLVAREEGGRSIGFPSEFVFPFSDQNYAALREAFETGDRRALLSMWQEVEHAS